MSNGPIEPGELVAGKYRIDRVLGAGVTGIVYAAQQLEPEQRVAMKFLHSKFASDATITERFLREAQAAIRIRNEHVARIFDASSFGSDQPYIVMEFLEGRDLATLLAGGARLEVTTAVGYVLQAAEAIAQAHANGIIHRDLKPANVFLAVREDGSMCIKVLDFGISTVLGGASAFSRTSQGFALPTYLAPEQIRSEKEIDGRTDIWALGVILFSLLIGRGPFEGENLDAVYAEIFHRTTPSLRELRDDVPEGLEAVVFRCLQKARDERYANVGELARALEPFAPPSMQAASEKIERLANGASGEKKKSASYTELTRVAAAPSLPLGRPLGAKIHVLGGPAVPSVYPLSSGICRVGSGPGCDIVVNEPSVSRLHVELALCSDGVEVRDLGSTNGTFYLGQRVQRMTLALGARIQIGLITLVLDADRDQLERVMSLPATFYRGVLGESSAMQLLFGKLTRLEASLTPVLLEGEPGVGKGAIARALHEGSMLSKGPLVTIHCGTLSRDLAESELFGQKQGPLGTAEERKGAFENADGGTLFLDEVCDLPLDVQSMLLHTLETGEVRRVGGDTVHQVKVRIVTGTSRDLVEEVREGRLREELYFRIAVVRLRVPSLHERAEEIPLLAAKFAADAGMPPLPPPIVEEFKARSWPGNVRELHATVQAYALGILPETARPEGAMLDLALRDFVDSRRSFTDQRDALLERFSAIWLEELLEKSAGSQSTDVRNSELDRAHLGRLTAKSGLGKESRER